MKPLKDLKKASLEQLIDCHVVDQNDHRIGTLRCLWCHPATGAAEFLGVQTGWVYMRRHVVPAENATLDEAGNQVRLPYLGAFIMYGPTLPIGAEIKNTDENSVQRYYSLQGIAGTDAIPAKPESRGPRRAGPGESEGRVQPTGLI